MMSVESGERKWAGWLWPEVAVELVAVGGE